jgi:protein O-GlcNAc transferase
MNEPQNPPDSQPRLVAPEARHGAMLAEGSRLQSEGRLRDASDYYRMILRENPLHADALHRLGLIAKREGKLTRARKLIRAAVRCGGSDAAIYCNNLANLLRQEEGGEARDLYRRALAADQNYADAWLNLATYEELQGNADEAIDVLHKAVDKCPDDLRLVEAIAPRLLRKNRYADAAPHLKRLIERDPDKAELWLKLGSVYAELGDRGRAMSALTQTLALDPENSGARVVLSQLLVGCAAPEEAEIMLLEAAKTDERAYAVLGNVYKDLGYMDLALDCYARALTHRPSAPDQSNFLYTLLYDPAHDHAEVAEEHRNWARTYAQPHRPAKSASIHDPNPDRPLRIGYVSGHFWDHAVALFSLPMIEAHDREHFQVYFYRCGGKLDSTADAFRAAASQWRDIDAASDDEAAEIVRNDRIDILVDLAGHIGGGRLLLFARKPAPIQVTYLGYQATTGMDVMDYRLTDAIADPPGVTDSLYVEKLVRLDPSFFVYRPSDYAPPVAPLPAEANAFVTFGCLNNPGKTGPWVAELWAKILKAVPESRLILLGPSRQDADPRVSRLFEAQGIESSRILFAGKRSRTDYLHVYDRIDIALDPFPFSGHTTTCDALWQGVPVVTLAGQTYAGRMSASTLTQARFPQWIAQTPEEYVQIARGLAGDIPSLANLRRSMRDHLTSAPILDAKGFTRSLEAAYRKMWQSYVGNAVSA